MMQNKIRNGNKLIGIIFDRIAIIEIVEVRKDCLDIFVIYSGTFLSIHARTVFYDISMLERDFIELKEFYDNL